MTDPQIKTGIRFDPTINLGHVLTFLGFLIAIFAAWVNLDKRVVVLEENRRTQQQIDNAQDVILNQHMNQIKESLNDLRNGVQRLNDRIDRAQHNGVR